MAYSGTVSTTVINVQTMIDHGARRCGKLAEELTSEQVLSARESLYFALSALANRGINYWAINKKVFGLKADQYIYTMPLGCIDVLNVLYRTMNRPSGDYATSFYGTDNPIYAGSIGILPYVAGGGTATWNIIYEYSVDGTTWRTLEDLGQVVVTDNEWIWTDVDPGQTVEYYRVRAYSGTTLALREWYVGNNARLIQMARLNRDDYTNLPNQNFTANQPYQFWFDRTIPQPTMYLWPVPNDPFIQMTVWYSRQIMDVGALTDELEVPQRWYEAVVFLLAHRMALEMPNVAPDRIAYLEKMSDRYIYEAEQEERDKSPIYFAPNIAVYTK